MERYVRDDVKIKREDSMRHLRNDFELYFKTLDQSTALDLTINYSFSEMKTKLLRNSGLVTSSTVTPFSAIQKSGKNY